MSCLVDGFTAHQHMFSIQLIDRYSTKGHAIYSLPLSLLCGDIEIQRISWFIFRSNDYYGTADTETK